MQQTDTTQSTCRLFGRIYAIERWDFECERKILDPVILQKRRWFGDKITR